MQRTINFIVITPTKTDDLEYADGGTERQAALLRGMRKTPYHYVIRKDGKIDLGRSLTEASYCLPGFDLNAIAIALVGTLSFTAAQESALASLVGGLKKSHPQVGLHDTRIGH